jgi:hypothetical protein
MPVPPNWFGLTAFALLGGFVSPGFWLIGLGLEIAYLAWLSRHSRFRAIVDAAAHGSVSTDAAYARLLNGLGTAEQNLQKQLETRSAGIIDHLRQAGAMQVQITGLTQLCGLHLRLLEARDALTTVVTGGVQENAGLNAQQAHLTSRLQDSTLDEALRRSLDQQLGVIGERLAAHSDAENRLELVNAEIERIRHQVSLIHEQSLLTTDADAITRSIDVLTASLNAAGDLLQDQRAWMTDLDDFRDTPVSETLLRAGRGRMHASDSRQLEEKS